MRFDTLEILRCPYCGGRLAFAAGWPLSRNDDAVQSALLQCACCTFPIVDGIPVLRVGADADEASRHLQDGDAVLARRALMRVPPGQQSSFDELAACDDATYRELVTALGLELECGYFLYRFSDPSFIVADALIRTVAGTVMRSGGRAIDICGGSGHLARSLPPAGPRPHVLADLAFAKLWLARRFTAPGCEAVSCDGNAPLPFCRGAFRYAMCADAFMFIWTKRQFVREMLRLIDDGRDGGAAVISHTHNLLQWSPSHGQPLTPDGYRDLFETVPARVFAESGLFRDVVDGRELHLERRDSSDTLAADPALVVVATRRADVLARHGLDDACRPGGVLRVNPLYVAESEDADRVCLRLRFPTPHYEEEFGACREYLPESVVVSTFALAELANGRVTAEVRALAARRVVLDLPRRYY
jgi:uncharacterized protein YbaR (Trm112 family)